MTRPMAPVNVDQVEVGQWIRAVAVGAVAPIVAAVIQRDKALTPTMANELAVAIPRMITGLAASLVAYIADGEVAS